MAGADNLIGKGFESRTTEEARELGRAGGIASGEARRRKKQIKEYLEILLEKEVSKDSNGNSISGAEGMAIRAVQAALQGDWKAWELVRDTAGQKPVEKVMVAEIDQDVIDEVEAAVLEDDSPTST